MATENRPEDPRRVHIDHEQAEPFDIERLTPLQRNVIRDFRRDVDYLNATLTQALNRLCHGLGGVPVQRALSARPEAVLKLMQAMSDFSPRLRVTNANVLESILKLRDAYPGMNIGQWPYHAVTHALQTLKREELILQAGPPSSAHGFSLRGHSPLRDSTEYRPYEMAATGGKPGVVYGFVSVYPDVSKPYIRDLDAFREVWARGDKAVAEAIAKRGQSREAAEAQALETPKPARKRAPKGTKPA